MILPSLCLAISSLASLTVAHAQLVENSEYLPGASTRSEGITDRLPIEVPCANGEKCMYEPVLPVQLLQNYGSVAASQPIAVLQSQSPPENVFVVLPLPQPESSGHWETWQGTKPAVSPDRLRTKRDGSDSYSNAQSCSGPSCSEFTTSPPVYRRDNPTSNSNAKIVGAAAGGAAGGLLFLLLLAFFDMFLMSCRCNCCHWPRRRKRIDVVPKNELPLYMTRADPVVPVQSRSATNAYGQRPEQTYPPVESPPAHVDLQGPVVGGADEHANPESRSPPAETGRLDPHVEQEKNALGNGDDPQHEVTYIEGRRDDSDGADTISPIASPRMAPVESYPKTNPTSNRRAFGTNHAGVGAVGGHVTSSASPTSSSSPMSSTTSDSTSFITPTLEKGNLGKSGG